MIDLIVQAIIVTPALIIFIDPNIRATEVVNTILFPTLGPDLRPFYHCVTVETAI